MNVLKRITKPTTQTLAVILVMLAGMGCGPDSAKPSGPAPETAREVGSPEVHSHSKPGETCYLCDATKRQKGRLWCSEHNRYEDRCWQCQPQLRDKERAFCEEHALYEDECFFCRPVMQEDMEPDAHHGSEQAEREPSSQGETSAAEMQCGEHRVPEQQCGICQPQLAAGLAPGNEMKVRFESSQSANKAGILSVPVDGVSFRPSLDVICEVAYNENNVVRITPLSAGIVAAVYAEVGAEVQEGDILLEIHSPEVAKAKADLISASVDWRLKEQACQREKRLAERNISSGREAQEADAACQISEVNLSAARQRLSNFGLTLSELETIVKAKDSSARLAIRAPFAGTLVERSVSRGESAKPGDSLFVLADLQDLWLELSVAADKGALLAKGMEVEASFPQYSGIKALGEITWVGTAIDESTRLLRARAVLGNSKRVLKVGLFGSARVFLGEQQSGVTVAKGAVQMYEGQPFVFVELEDDLYAMRRVELGGQPTAGMVTIARGVEQGEQIVFQGAFTAMSEFLKSRLGAGCVDD